MLDISSAKFFFSGFSFKEKYNLGENLRKGICMCWKYSQTLNPYIRILSPYSHIDIENYWKFIMLSQRQVGKCQTKCYIFTVYSEEMPYCSSFIIIERGVYKLCMCIPFIDYSSKLYKHLKVIGLLSLFIKSSPLIIAKL